MSGLSLRAMKILIRPFPLFAGVLIVFLSGCLGTGELRENPMDALGSGRDEIELLVRNHNFSQATIYTSREHGSKRLGIVNGKSEATLKFEWHLSEIRLRVKYLAGREFLTETLPVAPDDLLELILEARQ